MAGISESRRVYPLLEAPPLPVEGPGGADDSVTLVGELVPKEMTEAMKLEDLPRD